MRLNRCVDVDKVMKNDYFMHLAVEDGFDMLNAQRGMADYDSVCSGKVDSFKVKNLNYPSNTDYSTIVRMYRDMSIEDLEAD